MQHGNSHSKVNPSLFTLPIFWLFQKADLELEFLVMPVLDGIWVSVLRRAGC